MHPPFLYTAGFKKVVERVTEIETDSSVQLRIARRWHFLSKCLYTYMPAWLRGCFHPTCVQYSSVFS